jgi:hypothetical protein
MKNYDEVSESFKRRLKECQFRQEDAERAEELYKSYIENYDGVSDSFRSRLKQCQLRKEEMLNSISGATIASASQVKSITMKEDKYNLSHHSDADNTVVKEEGKTKTYVYDCLYDVKYVPIIDVLDSDCSGKYKEDVIIASLNSVKHSGDLAMLCVITAWELTTSLIEILTESSRGLEGVDGLSLKCLKSINLYDEIDKIDAKRLGVKRLFNDAYKKSKLAKDDEEYAVRPHKKK